MTFLKRLKWFSATLAFAGVVTSAAVWGDASRKPAAPPAVKAGKVFSEGVVGKFTNRPAVTYETRDGQTFFAIQVKPDLPAVAVRPRDIAILVDTTASQAGNPLETARMITREVIATANESDRISVWVVNTPRTTRNLFGDGAMRTPAQAKAALVALDAEYGSGAVDLKGTLERVAKGFDGKATRQQVILYLGDGESALNPLDEKTRFAVADDLRTQNIAFYAVPLGLPSNARNIHTMVSGTGGTVLRVNDDQTADQPAIVKSVAARFHQSMGVPVLCGATAMFAQAPAEVYPGKLPPLRADVPTLVVGRFEKGKVPAELTLALDGKVQGIPATAKVSIAVPAPAADNYFLGSVVSQWRDSGQIDAPAMLRADRTLAMAFETTRLAREEFLEQADWALGVKKFDVAKNLYEAAAKLDPEDPRTKSGLKLSGKLEKGEISLEDIKKATIRTAQGERVNVNQLVQEPKVDSKGAPLALPAPKEEPAPAADPNQLLRQEEAKQKIREQQTNVAVDETLSRARDLLKSGDPKSAKDLLVAQRDTVRVVGDLSEASRQKLLNRIDLLLTDVGSRGDAIVRAKAEENEKIARARQRLMVADQGVAREERIRERIRNFTTLMNQARYEDAYREALVMENEHVNEGRPVPIETLAVERIGQAGSNYRDFRELVRLREDRFLLTMMEVEKSHMPYPDEPAVHFPPAKVWRELTTRRREFSSTDFDRDFTPRQKQRFSILQSAMNQTLDLTSLTEPQYKLGLVLSILQDLISTKMKTDIKLYVNYNTFPNATDAKTMLKETDVNLAALKTVNENETLREITFKTVLDTVLRQAGWAFWITPDYLEIVPVDYAKTTKVFKVLPVEDLIVPIPNAVNTLSLAQNLQVLGQVFSLGGAQTFGGGNGFQAQGNGGGNGFNNGGGQGGGGQQQNANIAGQAFNGNGGGQGLAGFGGANNQFGQVGGGFSFGGGGQNGSSSTPPATELIILIQTVVDPGYWDPDISNSSQAKGQLLGLNPNDPNQPLVSGQGELVAAEPHPQAELNKLSLSMNTRSIVIYGRSRMHRTSGVLPLKAKEGMAGLPAANPDGRKLAGDFPKPLDPSRPAVKGPLVPPPANVVVSAQAPKLPKPGTALDAERIWKQAIDRGVRDPGAIIACADFLVKGREFKHAAELLKASLRTGITPERWYQDALAIALEESQGSAEDIERAYVSAVDLDASSPHAYLDVAQALNRLGQPDAAAKLCKVAAKLEPNVPDAYVHALACANNPKMDATYDLSAFAATGLLSRDWPSDRGELHAKARAHLSDMVKKLGSTNKKADADKLSAIIEADRRRDLVIELMWAGKADLDLRVTEPIGSQCSPLQPMTPAGGSLMSDLFDQKDDSHSEIYTAAQGYSGKYVVTVDKVWGATLGDKATVKVTKHQGMPDETVEYMTVKVGSATEVVVTLDAGRRQELAVLPAPQDMARYSVKSESNVQLQNKIRSLMNGNGSVGLSNTSGMAGGTGSSSKSVTSDAVAAGDKRHGDLSWSTRFMTNKTVGVDIRATTTIKADGTAHVSAAPVFDSGSSQMRVKLDLIPGGE